MKTIYQQILSTYTEKSIESFKKKGVLYHHR